jgi:hypothetical protein
VRQEPCPATPSRPCGGSSPPPGRPLGGPEPVPPGREEEFPHFHNKRALEGVFLGGCRQSLLHRKHEEHAGRVKRGLRLPENSLQVLLRPERPTQPVPQSVIAHLTEGAEELLQLGIILLPADNQDETRGQKRVGIHFKAVTPARIAQDVQNGNRHRRTAENGASPRYRQGEHVSVLPGVVKPIPRGTVQAFQPDDGGDCHQNPPSTIPPPGESPDPP